MFKFSRSKELIISILFIGMLTGCGTTDKMEFYNDTESTTLSEGINSISIDSKEDKVRQVFGEPISIEEIENSDSDHLVYDDLEFQIKNGKVVRYFYTNKYTTQKGIMVGDSKEDVKSAYGDNYYEREDTGIEIIGYFDKTNNINIEFGFRENLISVMVSKVD